LLTDSRYKTASPINGGENDLEPDATAVILPVVATVLAPGLNHSKL